MLEKMLPFVSEISWWLLRAVGIVIIILVPYACIHRQRLRRLSVLQRFGIPTMEPDIFFGNLRQYQAQENVLFDGKLVETHGKVCGYYFGAKPMIVMADATALGNIQKSPSIRRHFLDRPRRIPGGINPDKKRRLMLGNLPVGKWIEMRRILAPAFGAHNLGAMIESISSKITTFMELVDKRSEQEIDFYGLFQYLTLDVISKTAWGIDAEMQINRNDMLLKAVQSEFSKGVSGSLTTLYLCLPEVSPVLSRIRDYYHRFKMLTGWIRPSALWQAGAEAVERRRDEAQDEVKSKPFHDLLHHVMSSKYGLSDNEIVANTVLVYEAAYETTSSCLAFLVHILSHRPRVQRKIRREIRKKMKQKGNGLESFDLLQSLKYLEACIYEALRLYPTQTTFVGRSGDVTMTVQGETGKTYTIPQGVHIQAALFQIHRDSSLWEMPSKYRPQRFLTPQGKELLKSPQYQAFGHGPRECIGKAFALMTIKLVIGTLLLKYKLIPSERTEKIGSITIAYKTATMTPAKGSHARIVANG